MRIRNSLLACVLTLPFLYSCAFGPDIDSTPQSSNSTSNTSPPVGYTYEVRVGDDLKWIASTFTRNQNNWEKIAEFNGISNPQKLAIGQVITIPTELYISPLAPSTSADLDLPVAAAAPADIAPLAAAASVDTTSVAKANAELLDKKKAIFFKEMELRRGSPDWGERTEKFLEDYFSKDGNKDIPANVSRVWIEEYVDQEFSKLRNRADIYQSSGMRGKRLGDRILSTSSVYVPENRRMDLISELREEDKASDALLNNERELKFSQRRNALMQKYGEVSDTRMIELAKAEIRESLYDPGSAQFSRVTLADSNGTRIVCGFVNARNRLGGMAGRKIFMWAYDFFAIENPLGAQGGRSNDAYFECFNSV